MAGKEIDDQLTPALTKEAVSAIKALDAAIVKRRTAEAEVGKAQTELAAVSVRAASSRAELSTALNSFREAAMHW
jgi:hypothetical protein